MLLVVLAIALVGGGWLALGRIDPLLALPGIGWAAASLALLHPSPDRRVASYAALVLLLLLGVACGLLANRLPTMQLLVTGFGSWVAVAVAVGAWSFLKDRLAPGWRRIAVAAVMTVSLGLLVQALAWPAVRWMYEPATTGNRSLVVDVLTSLPLHRQDDQGHQMTGLQLPDAPFLLALRHHAAVRLTDSVPADGSRNSPLLLLAHPHAVPPAQLVATDALVRSGGSVLILADGLLSWPQPYPLGDPRNPPVTSMLGPLLDHWGLRLDAPADLGVRSISVHDMGKKLTMVSPGRLHSVGEECRILHGGLMADCRIGRGRALVVADADLLDERNWQPFLPADGQGTEASWSNSNPHWLLARLDNLAGVTRRPALARPVWVR